MKQTTLTTAILMLLLWSCSNKPKKQIAKSTDYDVGVKYYYEGKMDSAYLFYSRYVSNSDDILKKGQTYRYMGELLWTFGDLYGAEENMAAAIHTLDSSDEKQRAEIGYAYNAIGNISLDLRQYDSAISYYNKAINFLKEGDYMLEAMNGKATALQNLKHYDEAIVTYDSIFCLKPVDQLLIARIIDNRAMTKWMKDFDYLALPELWNALKIRIDSQYNLGLNASYAHLSDYYANVKPDSALWYAQQMFGNAQSPSDILLAMDKMIILHKDADQKQYWYKSYKALNDSLQFSRDTTKKRFALIRYDFQKSKADNLELQQHITKQRLLMYGLIVFAVIAISGLSYWFSNRRKRIKQESEDAIQNARLKTSQKVHDVVANGLYRIMNELEHGKSIDKEPLINKIEGLYKKSRNISYEEISPGINTDYNNEVHELLIAFDNEQTKVIVAGNNQTFWSRITGSQKTELQLVLNEIMVNMKKHSRAKKVVILFKQEDNKAFITYQDDGVGFPNGFEHGNGLKNTVNRINSLNGEVNFGKSELGGAYIAISFPLQSS